MQSTYLLPWRNPKPYLEQKPPRVKTKIKIAQGLLTIKLYLQKNQVKKCYRYAHKTNKDVTILTLEFDITKTMYTISFITPLKQRADKRVLCLNSLE